MNRRPFVLLAAAFAVVISIGFAAARADAARLLDVSPSTGLIDLQVVQLDANGFAPIASVAMCQAASGVPGPGGCGGPIEFDTTSSAGTFSHPYTVRRFISVPSLGRTVDCLVEHCLMEAAELSDITAAVATEISFASFPPPTTRGTLTASPRTHLHDDDVVALAGRGFTPNVTVQIAECNSAPHDPTDCLGFPVVTATTDASGAFTSTFTVARSIPTICEAAPGTCTIAAGEVTDFPATVVTVPLTFLPIANTISATPDAGLGDVQSVTVRGAKFSPNASVAFCETAGDALCLGQIVFTTSAPDGTFTSPYAVTRFLSNGTTGVDCRLVQCTIAAAELSDINATVVATPLQFGPPQSQADCKHDGWRNFGETSGGPFRNQGECLGYVHDND